MTGSNKNNYILIMAGGVGSRIWTKSRNHFSKQFIDILGIRKSLLQLIFDHFTKICEPQNIFIFSNLRYLGLIEKQILGIAL